MYPDPAGTGRLLPSLRLEAFRDGIEDMLILQALEGKAEAADLLDNLRAVVEATGKCRSDFQEPIEKVVDVFRFQEGVEGDSKQDLLRGYGGRPNGVECNAGVAEHAADLNRGFGTAAVDGDDVCIAGRTETFTLKGI